MAARRKLIVHVRIAPQLSGLHVPYRMVNNKASRNWDCDYELVVSFRYGLDEDRICKVAGLRNCDSGMTMSGPGTGIRDLMFPCGPSSELAYRAAQRLWKWDTFGAFRMKISCPVEHEGKDTYTPWRDRNGKLLERVKHRKLVKLIRANPPKKRKVA